jgi:hypothetical protein
MKVGDLVKFQEHISGMEGLTGVIVEINGDLFRVMWSNKSVGIEMLEMLEVINESR